MNIEVYYKNKKKYNTAKHHIRQPICLTEIVYEMHMADKKRNTPVRVRSKE